MEHKPTKQERLARIAKAAGARQTKEWGPKKRRKKRAPGAPLSCGCVPEDDEIKELVQHDNRLGSPWDLWWTRAEENEARRKAADDNPVAQRRRGWLRARGADNPGFPDLLCRALPPVLVEMKSKCSRHKLSEVQVDKIAELRAAGWIVLVAHGCEEAIGQLEAERQRRR